MRFRVRWASVVACATLVVAAVLAIAGDGSVRSTVIEPLTPEQCEGAVEIPSGDVRYAAWGDLRFEFRRPIDKWHLEAFVVGADPLLPVKGKDPKAPVVLADKDALADRKEWRSVAGPNCFCVLLAQGDAATRRSVAVGVATHADAKGGLDLYWRFAPPPHGKYALYDQRNIVEVPTIVGPWGEDVKPRVIPFLAAKKEETSLVLRKGKRIAAVVRYQPAIQGGDPYPRLYISVDAAAAAAEGAVAFAEEKKSKALLKFAADHETLSWEPKTVALVLTLDASVFVVHVQDEPGTGTTYRLYAKPAP